MKIFVTILILMSSIHAGFFNENKAENEIVKNNENARLCKVFTQKANEYKKTIRKDKLAQKTLESYENRAKTYCTKS